MVFREPPGEGDLDRWLDLFARTISDHQPTEHLAFGWDVTGDNRGDLELFLARGMEYEATSLDRRGWGC